MKHNYYAIYDRLAEMYAPLCELQNDMVARRSFKEACKINEAYKLHAEDLEIHRIGTFEDVTGTFTADKEIIERGMRNEE